MSGPTKTPLLDLLRRIPLDARLEYEHSPTNHSCYLVGNMYHRAADEIERLRAEVDKRDEVIKTQLTVLEQQDAELQKQDKHIASLNGAAIKALHAFKDYCGKNPEEDQEDLMEEFMDLSDLVVDPDA